MVLRGPCPSLFSTVLALFFALPEAHLHSRLERSKWAAPSVRFLPSPCRRTSVKPPLHFSNVRQRTALIRRVSENLESKTEEDDREKQSRKMKKKGIVERDPNYKKPTKSVQRSQLLFGEDGGDAVSRLGLKNPDFQSKVAQNPLVGRLPYSMALEELISNPKLELVGALLVIASVFVVAIQTLPGLGEAAIALDDLEDIICAFFAIEYGVRWYVNNLSPTYLFQPLAIIDLLSISPLALRAIMMQDEYDIYDLGFGFGMEGGLVPESVDAGPLVLLKLLRILRLQRFLLDFETFREFEMVIGMKPTQIRPYQLQVARVVLSLFTLFIISSGLIYLTEAGRNPDIPDFFSAMYFGLTTLTTVGFGDISPVTPEGRLVVSLSIILGVTIIPVQLGNLAEAFMLDQRQMKSESGESYIMTSSSICNACGAEPHRIDAKFCWSCGEPMAKSKSSNRKKELL
mmetsp:Transcript_28620/g.45995  ORF Transcript_28620/g.45995 Transcript_28620/m.45995 type:complete len:458 (-) Transcript_28620:137-1510(-)